MNKDETYKLPRLFTDQGLTPGKSVSFSPEQSHYLKTVLRRQEGDFVRLFNGRDGEWLGEILQLQKKSGALALAEQILAQPAEEQPLHLIFTPIKKARLDWMIEKAVELGVTDFHPVLTHNTEVRKINEDRLNAQIHEAAEQCERLSLPKLHQLQKLENLLGGWGSDIPLYACLERAGQSQTLCSSSTETAILIGPEGGFTAEEKTLLAVKAIPVTLGETVLRCETAAVKAIILARHT